MIVPVSLLQFHQAWAWILIVGNALAGIWCLLAHRIEGLRTRALWWFIVFVEAAVFIQVITGVIMVTAQHKHAGVFHPFYGFVAVVVVGFLYSYREQLSAKRYLLYGFGGLFLMGVSIRALLVAHGG